jgi:hypothetical protein
MLFHLTQLAFSLLPLRKGDCYYARSALTNMRKGDCYYVRSAMTNMRKGDCYYARSALTNMNYQGVLPSLQTCCDANSNETQFMIRCHVGRIVQFGDHNETVKLSGVLSPKLGHLRKLQYLFLANAGFRGAIPREFGRLVDLEILHLRDNRLIGSLPKEIYELYMLRAMYKR